MTKYYCGPPLFIPELGVWKNEIHLRLYEKYKNIQYLNKGITP